MSRCQNKPTVPWCQPDGTSLNIQMIKHINVRSHVIKHNHIPNNQTYQHHKQSVVDLSYTTFEVSKSKGQNNHYPWCQPDVKISDFNQQPDVLQPCTSPEVKISDFNQQPDVLHPTSRFQTSTDNQTYFNHVCRPMSESRLQLTIRRRCLLRPMFKSRLQPTIRRTSIMYVVQCSRQNPNQQPEVLQPPT